jgi:hypothetical protein
MKASTLEKIDQRQQRKAGTEILMRLSEQSLEVVNVFRESRRSFIIIFLFHKAANKKLKPFAHVKKALI